MARNDIVLLDSLVNKAKIQIGPGKDESQVFELFCFDQILKDFDLSSEEIETGWTDGIDDGGIDGFFIFVDGHLVIDDDFKFAAKQHPNIEIDIFTVKRSDAFSQEPLNSISNSLKELLDLTIADDELSYPFRSEVLEQRVMLRDTLFALADRHPSLFFQVHFCTRGDTGTLAVNLRSRADLIEKIIGELFGNSQANVNFVGATELLSLSRKQPDYSLRLKYKESYISQEGGNYIVLVPLSSYCDFVTDEEGKLRRYLFESNIRDYLGPVQVNHDIRKTLNNATDASVEDFWWLNNGVTILATHANVVGKEIFVENVQIVNGLQTTETIYEYFKQAEGAADNRSILIKILLSADEQTRARIIKATNYQNSVSLSFLRGLDMVQRNIEQFLFDYDWYYDRRKNYYKNQGRPFDRIISIQYLASAVRAIALGEPARSQRQRAKSLRDDKVYKQVFSEKWDLNIYLACLEITRATETAAQAKRKLTDTPPIALVHYIAYVYACEKLGKIKYRPSEVATLVDYPPTPDDVNRIREDLENASKMYKGPGEIYNGIKLSQSFIEWFVRQRFLDSSAESSQASPHPSTSQLSETDIEQLLRNFKSCDLLSTEAEIVSAYKAALSASSPLERILQARVVLKSAIDFVGPKDGARVYFTRTIRNSALEKGIPKEEVDSVIKVVHAIYGSIQTYYERPTEKHAVAYLEATAKILSYLGIEVEQV